jgi:protein-S-isoprenylcysteine O-methyltransferase Ste14
MVRAETWFKIAFAVAFLWAVTVAASTARQATRRHGGSLNQLEHEVRGLIAVRAGLGLVFYAMLGVWIVRSQSPAWAHLPVPEIVRWGAVAMLLPILAFFTWSFRSLGTNYRGGVGLYADHQLVTAGAYRWVRHPIYIGFVAVMLAVMLLSANWVLGVAGILLVMSIAVARIPVEESELRERFPAAWKTYSERTGRIFPRFPRG